LDRTELLGFDIPVATTWLSRLLGLALLSPERAGAGLLIPRCRSVHTFGMLFPLDLLFLDREGRVVELRSSVAEWCAARPRMPCSSCRPQGDAVASVAMTRLIGINHVALEVGDVDEALDWYGGFFEFELRGRIGSSMAFIDMGDQFIALATGRSQSPDQARHFGLVVDDMEGVRAALREVGVDVAPTGSLDFSDPWGNHVQVVDYRDIQFTKAPLVLRAMGIEELPKTEAASEELRRKGVTD
jgi:catechol 2,3-dioxygenase-like lactoylglutathione lyase family enzyme